MLGAGDDNAAKGSDAGCGGLVACCCKSDGGAGVVDLEDG